MTLGAWSLALPHTLAGWTLARDGIGYLGTAHNWLQGAGWVDPIVYSHYLPDARPPVPAFAIRPPLVSLLLALPLALGGGVTAATVFHTLWAGLVAAVALLVARRAMSLPAATGFAVVLTWCPGWIAVSRVPLSEASAVAVLLLALAAVRTGVRSVPGALLLAAITLVGWLTRPNLGLILPAVVAAVALDRGPRAALRSRPLWVYALCFVAIHRVIAVAVEAGTGFAPYAHYGVMAEILDMDESHLYRKPYVGWVAYLAAHREAILDALGRNAIESWQKLFAEPYYLRVGWLALPGLAVALVRGGEGSLERRFAACAALGFTALGVATYGGFDAERYLLLGVVCAWFAVMSAADAASGAIAARCEARRASRPWRALARGAPAILAIGLFATQGGPQALGDAREAWSAWRQHGTSRHLGRRVAALRSLCGVLDADARVASSDPWQLYLWCGNAGLRLPGDLETDAWVERYLDEQQPGYVVLDRHPEWEIFRRSPRLRKIASARPFEVYEVEGAGPESRPWLAPPPLASLGDGARALPSSASRRIPALSQPLASGIASRRKPRIGDGSLRSQRASSVVEWGSTAAR